MVDYVALVNNLLKVTFAINVFTVLGSIITFVIFSRRAFKKSSIGFYCKTLAIFDLFVLLILIFGIVGQILNVQLIAANDIVCKVVYFLSTATSPIQGWILIVFSVDQLITVSMTDRFAFVRKRWFQLSIVVFIFIFHCCIYTTVFFYVGSRSQTLFNSTYYLCASYSLALQIEYLIEASAIPFVAMLITTVKIVKILIKSRRRTSIHPGNGSLKVRTRDLKFAFNSVILNILFILLSTPLVVYYMIPIGDFTVSAFYNVIFFIVFYLNYALHFWVHFFVNSYFRNELLVLLRIRNNQRRKSVFSLTLKNTLN